MSETTSRRIPRRTSKRIVGVKSVAVDDLPTIVFPHERDIWPRERAQLEEIITLAGMTAFISTRLNVSPVQIGSTFTQYWNIPYAIPEQVFVSHMLPWLVTTAANHDKYLPRIPSLHARTNTTLTQRQSSTIVALMWFGLCGYDFVINDNIQNYPQPRFSNVFRGCTFALACIIGYFVRMMLRDDPTKYEIFAPYLPNIEIEATPGLLDQRRITYVRSSATHPSIGRVDIIPVWSKCDAPLTDVMFGDMRVDDNNDSLLHLVSSMDILGGRIFTSDETTSTLYEDVIYCIRPDCLPLLMLAPDLQEDAIAVIGAEKYSQYSGVGSTVYIGPVQESAEDVGVVRHVAVFLDMSQSNTSVDQFQKNWARDMSKLSMGMSAVTARGAIACSHPTYRGIGGDIELRFLQLWMAASASKRTLIYHAPAKEFEATIDKFYNFILDNAYNIAHDTNSDTAPHPTVSDLMYVYKTVIRRRIADRRMTGIKLFREMMSV